LEPMVFIVTLFNFEVGYYCETETKTPSLTNPQ
jgi:hypothetical protein